MEQFITQFLIPTCGEGQINITSDISDWIKSNQIYRGLLVISTKHTSCSLIINENADPRVLHDLSAYMKSMVPEKGIRPLNSNEEIKSYTHADEGPDDMPAHIRTVLTSSNLSLSIDQNKLMLGTWQGIYLWEHRNRKNTRKLHLHAIGTTSKDLI